MTIISVFAVLFCLVSVVLPRHKADLYSLLYPQNVNVEKSETVERIELKKGDFFVLGAFYGEDIVWEVIDDGENPLAWSLNAICFRAFDESSSDWATSDLKIWLNDETENGFLCDKNFSETQRDLILKTDGEKIFLLSKNQLQKFPEIKRAKAPTVSAIANDGSDKLVIRRNCWYWTSSPIETNSSSVTAVTQTGGFYKTLSSDTLVGVCPAFYLNENVVYTCGGDGTKEKPYVIDTVGFGEIHNGIE